MSNLQVGESVQYLADTINGPRAAVITKVNDDGSYHLMIFKPGGGIFPAFTITDEPATPVQHYWRRIPGSSHLK